MRYAQILNDKVHWIFEDDLTLEQLGQQKRLDCQQHAVPRLVYRRLGYLCTSKGE